MRRLLIGLAAGILAVVPVMVLAQGGGGRSRAGLQTFVWTSDPATTLSTTWAHIPGLENMDTFCNRDAGAVATLSLQLASGSGPIEVRIQREAQTITDAKGLMKPGKITIDTGSAEGSSVSSSFSFVRQRVLDGHGEVLSAQWRSPDGTEVTLQKGSLVLVWDPSRDRSCI